MLSWLRDTLLRMFPHATRPGLRAIGQPDGQAPVLVTGNYALTVRRLRRVLEGRNVWLLVCNSRGINVWCAAAGGHFTDHDVISAIRTSGLFDRLAHRSIVLPQLAAAGIQPGKIDEATGINARWGPARLEDLPSYLDRGCKVTHAQRRMRFPLWERLEMAVVWAAPMTVLALAVGWAVAELRVGCIAGGVVLAQVVLLFVFLPKLPIAGPKRWLTYGGAAFLGVVLGAFAIELANTATWSALLTFVLLDVLAMGVLSLDLAGTTPWYPSTINSVGNRFHLELLEDRCTGAATCVQVCPRDVLSMNGQRRKVEVRNPEACIRCGACIVQCPDDALRFRFDDGRVVEPETVRTTRVNMLGRRAEIDPLKPVG